MNKAFLAGCDFNECTKGHKAGYLALVNGADFGVICNGFNNHKCALCIITVNCGNKYLAVIIDVDFAVAVGLNLLNNLAARTDNLTDFVGMNGGLKHFRSIF